MQMPLQSLWQTIGWPVVEDYEVEEICVDDVRKHLPGAIHLTKGFKNEIEADFDILADANADLPPMFGFDVVKPEPGNYTAKDYTNKAMFEGKVYILRQENGEIYCKVIAIDAWN